MDLVFEIIWSAGSEFSSGILWKNIIVCVNFLIFLSSPSIKQIDRPKEYEHVRTVNIAEAPNENETTEKELNQRRIFSFLFVKESTHVITFISSYT